MKNKKLILIFVMGFFLISMISGIVSARDFNIFNATNPTQSYFFVNGTIGYIGIGTTTPQNELNVIGDGNFTGNLYVNGANITGDYVPYTGASSNVDLGANNFSVGTNKLFVNSVNGNVGIGTSNPTSKLDVEGSARFDTGGAQYLKLEPGSPSYGTTVDFTYPVTGGARINPSSGFGHGANFEFIGEDASNSQGQVKIRYGSEYVNIDSTQAFIVDELTGTSGSGLRERFRIAQGGNVGIGTTSPTQTLDVNGKIIASNFKFNDTNASILIGTNTGNTLNGVTALGYQSAYSNKGLYVTASGSSSANGNTGTYLTATGYISAYGNTGSSVTAIGYQSAYYNTGSFVTATGRGSAIQNTGSYVTATGYLSANVNSGNYSSGFGYQTLYNNSGNNVVALGYQAGNQNSVSNQFIVQQANVNAVPLIQGNFATGNVGIGTTTPQNKLNVLGSINATSGNVSITSGNKFCLTQDCSKYMSYNGTGIVIQS